MNLEWAIDVRNQCIAARVAFFFKQWGGRSPKAGGRLLEGDGHASMRQHSAPIKGSMRSPLPELPDGLPTPRYTLAADCADLSLFCLACLHRAMADLDDLVHRGDTPLIRIRWKCGQCGSTKHVSPAVAGRDKR